MKNFTAFFFTAVLALGFAACSSPSGNSPAPASADNYFFPRDRTFDYTYSLDSTTETYQVRDTTGGFMSLVNQNVQGSISPTLYLFKQTTSADGSVICLLSNSPQTNGFIALEGTLDLGSTWTADDAGNIQAAVVGKYAEYYLPGRQVHYNDVVVVKYTDKTAPADHYVIRYFANGYGLILERTVTSSTQSADLQLV